jgi:hypothetical protein
VKFISCFVFFIVLVGNLKAQISTYFQTKLFLSQIEPNWGSFPGAEVSVPIRFTLLENKFFESIFIEAGPSLRYQKGYLEIDYSVTPNVYKGYEDNFRFIFEGKIGTYFNFRNSKLVFKAGFEKYYLPIFLNPNLYDLMMRKGRSLEFELGLVFNKFINEVSISYNRDLTPINVKTHPLKSQFLGVSITKKII